MSRNKHTSGEKDVRMRVAWILRQHRLAMKIEQQDVANSMYLSQSTFQRIETGKSAMRVEQFFAICHIIKLDPVAVVKAVQG